MGIYWAAKTTWGLNRLSTLLEKPDTGKDGHNQDTLPTAAAVEVVYIFQVARPHAVPASHISMLLSLLPWAFPSNKIYLGSKNK